MKKFLILFIWTVVFISPRHEIFYFGKYNIIQDCRDLLRKDRWGLSWRADCIEVPANFDPQALRPWSRNSPPGFSQ